MKNYSDQTHAFDVGLDVHNDRVAVAKHASHTNAVEEIDYG